MLKRLVLLVLLFSSTVALAAGGADMAAQQAAASTGGRVLDVRAGEEGSRTVYVVRVLMPDGRVKVVRVPAGAKR